MAIFISTLLTLSACSSTPNIPAPTETENSGIASAGAPTSKAAPPPTVEAAYMPATADGPAQNVPIPVLPDKAKEFSKDGLIAFAEYWYSTLGYAFETGDPDPMMAVTEASCKTCAFVNKPLVELYASGGWIVGGKVTVHEATATFQEVSDGTYQTILMIQQEKVSAYNADKSLSNEHPQHRARANIVVAHYSNNEWHAQTAEALAKD